ncbi:SDR family NAD(P)-dependent oxidoreductase, partial [Thauera sp. 63]|uniref:SDR family NAD(P)-dependent oxidoreductase n=1 Tax=Thauera sp. 63 TaxID=497321 RepID=UPI0002D0BA8A
MRLTDARVVLTGATGGLGEALARQLAMAGASLLLTARDPARLERLASAVNGPCSVLAADLTAAEGVDRLPPAAPPI